MQVQIRPLAIALGLVAFSGTCLNAQSTGTLVGTVTDSSGAVVADASVKITNNGTGQSRTVTTNAVGSYQAAQLQVGNYNVEVTSPGFKKYEQTGVVLNVNDTARVDGVLQVGQA